MNNNSNFDDRFSGKLYIYDVIDSETIREVSEALEYCHDHNQTALPIFINSPGGCVVSLHAILDLLEASDLDIITINEAQASSCASILLSAGTPGMRYAYPSATVLIHDISTEYFGNREEVKNQVDFAYRLGDSIFKRLIKYTSKTKKFWATWLKANYHDRFLTALEAKELGLVDHVCVPQINIQEVKYVVVKD